MSSSPRVAGDLYAERYGIDSVLGRGGMGSVSRVYDVRAGVALALKQLVLPENATNPELRIALFRREYQILTQLAHPNVVRVFDYGVVDGAPYYTMELITGRSVRERAPLPWRAVCAYAIELAGALAVLHGRGFLHRDLTPGNVLIGEDDAAKLIDFGAMTPIGPNDSVVGTPPYMAPETLEHGPLDSRVDVFGLGALTYWMLTGRHAYPAQSLRALPDSWLRAPPPPSHYDAEIPSSLDQLVAAMLSLAPEGRPSRMVELTQRFCEMIGRPTPPVQAPQLNAHLVTPKLIGRAAQCELAVAYAVQTQRSHGATLLITGDPGMGRSRMLEAFALEAKLAGCLTLHVQANAAQERTLGAIRDAIASLVQQAPERAESAAEPVRAALAEVWPSDVPDTSMAPHVSVELQQAIVTFFRQLTQLDSVALCVDDCQLLDAPSLQVLAELAHETRRRPLLLIGTITTDSNAGEGGLALDRLREASEPVPLPALSLADTEALLGSILGEFASIEALSQWVYRIAEGRPQTSLDLLGHLVSRRSIEFTNGRFRLATTLDDLQLPQDVEQMLQARLDALSPAARAIVELLSLATRQSPLREATLLSLVAAQHGDRLAFEGLTELLGRRIVKPDRDYYSFAQPPFAKLVHEQMPLERRRQYCAQLGALFREQGPDFIGIAAYYFQEAGDIDQSYATLFVLDSTEVEVDALIARHARSAIGQALYERMLQWSKERGDGPAKLFRFRKILLQLAAVDTPELTRYAPETLAQLRYDIGLDAWERFADAPDPLTRLVRCFELAQARWQATEPAQRGLDPSVALKEFAICVALLTGACVPLYDAQNIETLPATIEPLRALAPVLDIVYLLTKSAADSVVRGCCSLEQRRDIARRLREPVAGMDTITQTGAYLLCVFYVGLDLAVRGDEAGVANADELEAEPTYAVLGKQLRLVHALSQGDFEQTRRRREERDLLALQSQYNDQHRESSLRWEASAYYRAGDLLGIKELTRRLQLRAERVSGVRPILHALRAQYHLLCAEPERALGEIGAGQALARPAKHAAWRELALLEMEALLQLGRHAQALALVERTEALLASLGYDSVYEDRLTIARAEALAAAGETARARGLIVTALPNFEPHGPNGVPTAALYEVLARLALRDNDRVGFQLALERVKQIYHRGKHPGLVARYERLAASAREQAMLRSDSRLSASSITEIRSGEQRRTGEQLRQLLGLVLEETGSSYGYLYGCMSSGRLEQLAQRGAMPTNPALELALHQHLASLTDGEDEVTRVAHERSRSLSIQASGASYVPILLRDAEQPYPLLGVVAVAASKPTQIGRGLLSALARTLKALLTAA